MPKHSRRGLNIAFSVLLIAGALVVIVVSSRSLYKTFSTSIHPVAQAPQVPVSSNATSGQSNDQSQKILESVFGGIPSSTNTQPTMDPKTLRTMLVAQGITPSILESLSDNDLLSLYKEFLGSVKVKK